MLETKYLRDDMRNIRQLFAIPALKHFENRDLAKLLRLSKVRTYGDGETIIREMDRDPWVYFLLAGCARRRREVWNATKTKT